MDVAFYGSVGGAVLSFLTGRWGWAAFLARAAWVLDRADGLVQGIAGPGRLRRQALAAASPSAAAS